MKERLKEGIRLTGRVRATVRDARTGKVLRVVETKNLIVTAGKNHIATLLTAGTGTVKCGYCGVGSSDQTPAVSDTDLIAAIGSRKAVTDAFRTGNIATFSTFFGSGDNNGTWNECGLFWDSSGGDMLARALFTSPITKDASKTVTVDWDITIG